MGVGQKSLAGELTGAPRFVGAPKGSSLLDAVGGPDVVATQCAGARRRDVQAQAVPRLDRAAIGERTVDSGNRRGDAPARPVVMAALSPAGATEMVSAAVVAIDDSRVFARMVVSSDFEVGESFCRSCSPACRIGTRFTTRVAAVCRRPGGLSGEKRVKTEGIRGEIVPVCFDGFVLDRARRLLTREGEVLHLTPKAFDLLSLLVDQAPRVVPKSELHERLWKETFVSDATLVGVVKELRRVLDDRSSDRPIIRTAHRVGYAFCRELADRNRPGRSWRTG